MVIVHQVKTECIRTYLGKLIVVLLLLHAYGCSFQYENLLLYKHHYRSQHCLQDTAVITHVVSYTSDVTVACISVLPAKRTMHQNPREGMFGTVSTTRLLSHVAKEANVFVHIHACLCVYI